MPNLVRMNANKEAFHTLGATKKRRGMGLGSIEITVLLVQASPGIQSHVSNLAIKIGEKELATFFGAKPLQHQEEIGITALHIQGGDQIHIYMRRNQ